MEIFAIIALVCWGIAHILFMVCTRHIGMDNPPDKVVKLDIWNMKRLKLMFPPSAYRMYVAAQVLFVIGATFIAVKGIVYLLS